MPKNTWLICYNWSNYSAEIFTLFTSTDSDDEVAGRVWCLGALILKEFYEFDFKLYFTVAESTQQHITRTDFTAA